MTTPMPRDPSSQAELHQVLAIVGYEYGKPCPPISGVDRFGELFLFTDEERDQLHAMRELIRQYVARPDPRITFLGPGEVATMRIGIDVRRWMTLVPSAKPNAVDDRHFQACRKARLLGNAAVMLMQSGGDHLHSR